ncbi:heavy metal translocating P-type ATPase [Deinococcus sp. VB142]|uniref:Heavy metal translocating P-type ATPase n=1 Tax=Deinococcus sp. VB142 TaxID=3112952 RepID=A0AAU6Q762_9DEIO
MTSSGVRHLNYFVENMDCADCVRKVERLVGNLPGTADVKTSFARQTLELDLDESQTAVAVLERHLRELGYPPQSLVESGGEGSVAGASPAAEQAAPWYAGGQGRLVLVSGALLALAWVLGLVAPAWAQAAFAVATLVGVGPLARRAWAGLRLGDPFSINLLVTLAAVGALLIGEAAEGAVVVFLFAVGELLEGVAAGRARAGIAALSALAPRTALLLEGGQVREVSASGLQPGQQVQVRPGARVPADGTILEGQSSLDDSPVTGESVPVSKSAGDSVYAGSINGEGVLTLRVDRAGADNTIARIIRLVEEAESSKAPVARFIDRFSRRYTPAVMLVAGLVATVPPLLLGQPWNEWLYKGLALLLIGCPCALVLSVPAAVTSAISAGTRRGLLIKGGAALETVGRVRTVAFDKTGTLTAGRPVLTGLFPAPGVPETDLLRLAAAAEAGSDHPLARAVVQAAQERGLALPPASGSRALAGRGVEATVEGQTVQIASPAFVAQTVPLPDALTRQIGALEEAGQTVAAVLRDAELLGLLALRDEPRPDAADALARLRRLGLTPVMLTGDNPRTAAAIAGALGLGEYRAGLLPEDKLRIIGELPGPVAMVGDGINDAPALARASVGIALGGGTDVALETAQVALLQGRVGGVADLVELSRATLANIRQNVAFALGLKAIFLVTTLLGHTNLWMAVLADTGATAIVTANALRLLRWRPTRQEDAHV